MKLVSPLLIALLTFVVSQGMFAAEEVTSCEEQREHLLFLLRQGAELAQRRLQEVQSSTALSETTRADFRQSAEWLVAWLRDQTKRLEGNVDCAELSRLAMDARIQVMPFHLASLRAHATRAIWEIDRLLQEVPTESSWTSALLTLGEARERFREVYEGNGMTFPEVRSRMRHAVFLTRQGLRSLRRHGIME